MPDFPRGEWKKGQPEPNVTKLTARPVQSGSSCITAKEIAYTHIAWIVKEHKKEDFIILDKENDTVRDIYYVRYKDAPSGLKPIIIHKFIIANNETDSVHMFIFESPVETWDADWKKYGTPILEKIKVIMVADKQ